MVLSSCSIRRHLELIARHVVNAAGLNACALATRVAGWTASIPVPHWAKGNYFALAGRSPLRGWCTQCPEPGGLGVHLTLDLGGQARFWPRRAVGGQPRRHHR